MTLPTTRTAAAALPFLLVAALLAGCSDAAPTTTNLAIEFAGQHDTIEAPVDFDAAARPAAAHYETAGFAHPDFYNAHDQLEAWSQATGTPYEATSYSGAFGNGFFLTSVAGLVADGIDAYWSLSVNGQVAELGMSDLELHAGDQVAWTFTRVDAGSTNGGGLGLQVEPAGPTRNETLRLTGTLAAPAKVSVAGRSVDAAAGPWQLDVALDYGRTLVSVVADDGVASEVVDVVLVRLALATMEVVYTSAVPPHDSSSHEVWYDPDAFASAPLYEGTGVQHPGVPNVHDVMVTWTAQTGTPIEYGGPGSFGFSVDKIDGVGQPLTAAAPPYWGYRVNGETASLGITSMEAHPGDAIRWEYLA